MPKLTSQKLHSTLKKAGLKPGRFVRSGMIRGYGEWTPGYRIVEKKSENPNWSAYRAWSGPQLVGSGVFVVTHSDHTLTQKIITALESAGLPCRTINDNEILVGESPTK